MKFCSCVALGVIQAGHAQNQHVEAFCSVQVNCTRRRSSSRVWTQQMSSLTACTMSFQSWLRYPRHKRMRLLKSCRNRQPQGTRTATHCNDKMTTAILQAPRPCPLAVLSTFARTPLPAPSPRTPSLQHRCALSCCCACFLLHPGMISCLQHQVDRAAKQLSYSACEASD